jgi:hypothetical protein
VVRAVHLLGSIFCELKGTWFQTRLFETDFDSLTDAVFPIFIGKSVFGS